MINNKIRKGFHVVISKFNVMALRKAKGELFLLYKIVKEIKQNHWTYQEKEALKKINKLRKFYSHNQNEISITDYGFGSSNDNRTDEQMQKGVEQTKIVSTVYQSASSSIKLGEFMFKIIREYKPVICFELGTCLGVSSAYGAEALSLNKNNGEYITLEGAPKLAQLSKSTLEKFSFTNCFVVEGRFVDSLPHLLKKYNNIDFAFIDGHHEENATIKYFEAFYSNLSQKAILIFDDINWSNGMRRAWKTIRKDDRITWSVDNFFRGVCFIDKANNTRNKSYRIWF